MNAMEHLGLQMSAEDVEGVVLLDVEEHHLNAMGTVHGGVLATMVDTAMATAVYLAGHARMHTISMTVNYVEPGRAGRLEARARVRRHGRRTLFTEAEVRQDRDGTSVVVADASASFNVSPA